MEKENSWNKQKTNSKMVDLNPTISITAPHINGLTTSIKRQDCQSGYKTNFN